MANNMKAKPIPQAQKGNFYNAVTNDTIEVRMILACDKDGILGYDGDMVFKNPDDMKFFKEKTMNSVVVMGRKTFESMGSVGLKGRVNIVMTNDKGYATKWGEEHKGGKDLPVTHFVSSLAQVLEVMKAEKRKKLWCIGGGKLYSLFIPYAMTVCITYYQTSLLDNGVAYGLLPEGYDPKKLTYFAHLSPVRRKNATTLSTGIFQVDHAVDGCIETARIPYMIYAYTLRSPKLSEEAKKAMEAAKKAEHDGFVYAGGPRTIDRSRHGSVD